MAGLFEGQFVCNGDEGVDLRVGFVDVIQDGRGQFHAADLFFGEQVVGFTDGEIMRVP